MPNLLPCASGGACRLWLITASPERSARPWRRRQLALAARSAEMAAEIELRKTHELVAEKHKCGGKGQVVFTPLRWVPIQPL